jgi:hypothetical protein
MPGTPTLSSVWFPTARLPDAFSRFFIGAASSPASGLVTCYFINTARGGCVDQGALVRALEEGLIAGAGIDVTVDEPISKENPLLKMANVILTGHSAYYSTTSSAENFLKPMTQVIKAIRGQWPEYAVNPEVRKKWIEKWGSVPR